MFEVSKGEFCALITAILWTGSAIFAELTAKRMEAVHLNVIRMIFSLTFLGITLFFMTGYALPQHMGLQTILWLAVSSLIGYVFGDMCLMKCYQQIGSRYGQLFMTLAPPAAAFGGVLLLGEQLSAKAWAGMCITLTGISLSVLSRTEKSNRRAQLKLPLKGVLLAIGAAMGQGFGLVFSKIGLDYYANDLANIEEQSIFTAIPFAATFVRASIGLLGFVAVMIASKKSSTMKNAVADRTAMATLVGATICGPFIGVALSLQAVRFTHPGVAQTIMSLSPVLILLPAYYIFHQKVTLKEIIGAIISVCGVAIFFI